MNTETYYDRYLTFGSARTAKDLTLPIVQRLCNRKMSDLLHAAIGMCTEAGEQMVNLRHGKPIEKDQGIIEEAGDHLWYIALALRALSKTFDDINVSERLIALERLHNNDPATNAVSAAIEASVSMDVVKRALMYGKEFEEERFMNAMGWQLLHIGRILRYMNSSFEDAMQRNFLKLKARYPDAFNENDALNRDLVAEAKALDAKAT